MTATNPFFRLPDLLTRANSLGDKNPLNLPDHFKSIKDFGAVGDGVTDDAAAIQAAVDYCQDNHVDLIIPTTNAHYYVSTEIIVTESLTIHGNGERSQIKNARDSEALLVDYLDNVIWNIPVTAFERVHDYEAGGGVAGDDVGLDDFVTKITVGTGRGAELSRFDVCSIECANIPNYVRHNSDDTKQDKNNITQEMFQILDVQGDDVYVCGVVEYEYTGAITINKFDSSKIFQAYNIAFSGHGNVYDGTTASGRRAAIWLKGCVNYMINGLNVTDPWLMGLRRRFTYGGIVTNVLLDRLLNDTNSTNNRKIINYGIVDDGANALNLVTDVVAKWCRHVYTTVYTYWDGVSTAPSSSDLQGRGEASCSLFTNFICANNNGSPIDTHGNGFKLKFSNGMIENAIQGAGSIVGKGISDRACGSIFENISIHNCATMMSFVLDGDTDGRGHTLNLPTIAKNITCFNKLRRDSATINIDSEDRDLSVVRDIIIENITMHDCGYMLNADTNCKNIYIDNVKMFGDSYENGNDWVRCRDGAVVYLSNFQGNVDGDTSSDTKFRLYNGCEFYVDNVKIIGEAAKLNSLCFRSQAVTGVTDAPKLIFIGDIKAKATAIIDPLITIEKYLSVAAAN